MAIGFKIATQAAGTAGLTLLASLTTALPDPQAYYRLYLDVEELGDKTRLGTGAPWAEWRFPLLTIAERNQLRTFCASASVRVYITTIGDDQATLHNYLAVMIWPQDEPPAKGGYITDLIIRFEDLQVQ